MDMIANIVLPVFGLIGIGYAAAWLRILPAGSDEALSDFVFTIAIPLLLFRTVVAADFGHGSPWLLWASYFPALAAIWATGTFLARRVFGRDARAGLVAGVSASHSNALLIGLPLVIIAYGTEGGGAMALLLAVHLALVMGASTVLIERVLARENAAPSGGVRSLLRSLARNVLLSPVFIGIIAGNVWNLSGVALPGPVDTLIDRLADVAATLALFAMGMSLRKFGVRGNVLPAIVLSALKLAIMPALVFALARWVFPLPPVWAKTMIVAAACPTGVNAYLIAARFRTGEALSSNTITLSTALAVVSVTTWLTLLEGY